MTEEPKGPAGAPPAGCITLAELRARGPVDEKPLTFEHLTPPAPVRRASVFRGRGGVWLVSRDLACPLDPVPAAHLFAPLSSEAQVKELLTRFQSGDVVPEARAASLLEALATRGFAAKDAEAGPAAKDGADPSKEPSQRPAPPPGGLAVTRAPDGFAAHAMLLRVLSGGAEVVLARYTFATDGRATRSEERLAYIAPPDDAAPNYAAGAPALGPDPERDRARTAHEARLKEFWDAVREGAPELAR